VLCSDRCARGGLCAHTTSGSDGCWRAPRYVGVFVSRSEEQQTASHERGTVLALWMDIAELVVASAAEGLRHTRGSIFLRWFRALRFASLAQRSLSGRARASSHVGQRSARPPARVRHGVCGPKVRVARSEELERTRMGVRAVRAVCQGMAMLNRCGASGSQREWPARAFARFLSRSLILPGGACGSGLGIRTARDGGVA